MRVMTPTGKIVEVINVEPCVETSFELNGRYQRVTNPAKDLSYKPTGIRMLIKCKSIDFSEPFLYIGNLPTSEVLEILAELGVSGFYNFSKMEYQKVSYDKVIVDGGSSLPYYNEMVFGNFVPLTFHEKNEDEEDEFDE